MNATSEQRCNENVTLCRLFDWAGRIHPAVFTGNQFGHQNADTTLMEAYMRLVDFIFYVYIATRKEQGAWPRL